MTSIQKLTNSQHSEITICIVGLGYTGLPLITAFSKHFRMIGFDIDQRKIDLLQQGIDPSGELDHGSINSDKITFTSELNDSFDVDIFIVTVPTPLTKNNSPDLNPLKKASQSIGRVLKSGNLVIYESTVFPGCTREICVPILEEFSGLTLNSDFHVGYSPERINPGDKVHRLDNTIKIVSASNGKSLEAVEILYSTIISAGLHKAPSIEVAESAKIVENIQRDLNIALMNELALIFDRMNIDTLDVIEAAQTKWNFQPYYPGLVGGHCISVDPHYFTYKAQELGYIPEVILSGRKVNDNVSKYISTKILRHLGQQSINFANAKILIMGVTFKENVRDIRNSKVIDLVKQLMSYNISVDIMDPYASQSEVLKETGIKMIKTLNEKFDCIVLAVKHAEFQNLNESYFANILHSHGLFLDIKGIYKNQFSSITTWTL